MAEKTIPFNQLGKAGYNRPINRAQVNKIKRNFNEDLVQLVIVSFRDGKYWIVDGQHTSQALYELNGNDPNTPIRCKVVTGLTYDEESDWYVRLNTMSKNLSFADKLKGMIESKEPTAVDFRDTVESCGYIVGGNTRQSLGALNVAWTIFNKSHGKENLTNVLSITHECWPDNKNGVESTLLRGLVLFLKNHGDEFQRSHLISAWSDANPKTLVQDAKTFYKQMDSKAYTQPYCMYVQLINKYNFGLRNKLQPVPPVV